MLDVPRCRFLWLIIFCFLLNSRRAGGNGISLVHHILENRYGFLCMGAAIGKLSKLLLKGCCFVHKQLHFYLIFLSHDTVLFKETSALLFKTSVMFFQSCIQEFFLVIEDSLFCPYFLQFFLQVCTVQEILVACHNLGEGAVGEDVENRGIVGKELMGVFRRAITNARTVVTGGRVDKACGCSTSSV